MAFDPYESLVDVARRLHTGTLSPVELTDAVLDRIEELDGSLHCYARVTRDLARAQAKKAEAEIAGGHIRGPLHGVPIAVKDNCDVAGVPTTNGLAVNDASVAREDATVVNRLHHGGAVLLGKLQQTEGAFAQHRPDITPPLNPWNAKYWPGASSSGPGVAPAAGLCFGALGTDTGGSIRFPAAANNLAGLKPTWGRVSRHGVFENSASMDHVGPMTRTVADAAAILAVLAGPDPLDPTTSIRPVPDYLAALDGKVGTLRIGIDETYNLREQDEWTVRCLSEALEVFSGLGAEIVPIKLTDVDVAVSDWLPLSGVEMSAAHAEVATSDRLRYGDALSGLITLGDGQSASDYFRRSMRRLEFKGHMERVFAEVDLVLTPVQTGMTPTLDVMATLGEGDGDLDRLVRYTAPFNMTGHPTLVLPGGTGAEELPLGFQLIGRHFEEQTVLRAGDAFQRETTWHHRHPNL